MVKNKKFPMTKAGKEKLEHELAHLKSEKRENVIKRIKTARSFCDFTEDSEYDEAIKEQLSVEERILTLENMIQHADIIKENDEIETVAIGKSVTFIELPGEDEETYTIVGIAEADPVEGFISNDSPIAKGLFGHRVHDEVVVQVPGEEIKVKITNIK